MKIKQELITPQRAKELLSFNDSNRKVRDRHVDTLARAMSNGEWIEESGDPIKISTEGELSDGQHRLLALIKAGKSFKFVVIYNVPEGAFTVMDTGLKRNGSDMFYLAGAKYSCTMSPMISKYYALTQGKTHKRGIRLNITNAMLFDIYSNDPEYWHDVARKSHQWSERMQHVLSAGVIGGLYAYFDAVTDIIPDAFFESLCGGYNPNRTITALRNLLYNNKFATKKILQEGVTYAIVVAWNHARAGREVSRIVIKAGTAIPKAI